MDDRYTAEQEAWQSSAHMFSGEDADSCSLCGLEDVAHNPHWASVPLRPMDGPLSAEFLAWRKRHALSLGYR